MEILFGKVGRYGVIGVCVIGKVMKYDNWIVVFWFDFMIVDFKIVCVYSFY